jgi:hypothetical protein
MSKSVYALQPYYVGSKRGKSLAIVLPVHLVRKYSLNESTIFLVRSDESKNIITLESMYDLKNNSEVLREKRSLYKVENKTRLNQKSPAADDDNGF